MASRQSPTRDLLPMASVKKQPETKDYIGELMRVPAPPPVHQLIVQKLLLRLHELANPDYFILQAPCDLQLSELRFRQPDLMLIKRSRADIIQPHAVIAPPDVVIEVLSPTSKALDCNIKLRQYADFGIPEYWIVDYENQQILQYTAATDSARYCEPKIYPVTEWIDSPSLGGNLFKADTLFNF